MWNLTDGEYKLGFQGEGIWERLDLEVSRTGNEGEPIYGLLVEGRRERGHRFLVKGLGVIQFCREGGRERGHRFLGGERLGEGEGLTCTADLPPGVAVTSSPYLLCWPARETEEQGRSSFLEVGERKVSME
jgi:hypothetical protein